VGVNEAAQLADGRTAAMGPRVGAAQERGEPETEELQGIYALERAAAKLPRAEPPEVPRAAAIGEGDEFWEEFPGFTGAFEAGHLWDHPEDWEAEFMEAGVNMTAAVRRWVWEGYSVYIDKSKLGASPRAYKLTPEEEEWAARKVIGEQIPAGSVEEVAREELPRGAVVCNVVVAYKNGEMSRLCWSGKPMNRASDKQKFRMESWLEILQLAEPGDWMFSLDFEKGYQQVPLKAAFKNFTLFALRGKTYRHRVLPFGLSSGPKDFSQIVRKVLAILRKRGVRCAFYIDDLIFFARSRDEARRLRGEVLRLLHRLNLRVSVRKSLLEPGQRIEHLGFELCTASMAVYVPAQKVVRYKRLAEAVLQHCRQPQPGREVARVIGKLQSFRLAMPATLIATRGLARCLQQLPLREDAAAAQRGDRIEWQTTRARSSCRSWRSRSCASGTSASGICGARASSGRCEPSRSLTRARGDMGPCGPRFSARPRVSTRRAPCKCTSCAGAHGWSGTTRTAASSSSRTSCKRWWPKARRGSPRGCTCARTTSGLRTSWARAA